MYDCLYELLNSSGAFKKEKMKYLMLKMIKNENKYL